MPRVLFVVGTRPEAIKLAPVIRACRSSGGRVEPIVCLTGQHRDLVPPVLDYFEIAVDEDLAAMHDAPPLAALAARCTAGIAKLLERYRPSSIVAQGDTTTVLAASVAAFYGRVPLVHVEAGLRTGDLQAPWPEEFNRRVATLAATWHCAPTEPAAAQLRAEGIAAERIVVTGNPVIDALVWTHHREGARAAVWQAEFPALGDAPLVLVTGHRRENLDSGLTQLAEALVAIARGTPRCRIVYAVHPNPAVRSAINQVLTGEASIQLIPPADYPEFVWLLGRASVILTDSGGIQEEAPALGKPVLVVREKTERPEALATGLVELVGTDPRRIAQRAAHWLAHPPPTAERLPLPSPFGDGRAAERIAELLQRI